MVYSGEQLREIIFPLGGIGSGSIGINGIGNLVDWEIFNRPSKGSTNGYSQISVRTVSQSGKTIAKSLTGDITKDLTGQYSKGRFNGYGFGPASSRMGGFSHFEQTSFDGRFPIAELDFVSAGFPGAVKLTAFNPFIPLDDKNSSIPAAFFEITYTNTSDEVQEFAAAFSVQNPFASSENTDRSAEGCSALFLKNAKDACDEVTYGDLTLASFDENCAVQPYWYRGGWSDAIVSFWNEFSGGEKLRYRIYPEPGQRDTGVLMSTVSVAPGESGKVHFVLTWNVPNCYNYWKPLKDDNGKDVSWKNYYAVLFRDSAESAFYALNNWEMLYRRTRLFTDTLHGSTLDPAIIDAVSATMSVLKSATVLRLEDGSLYGWEGCMEEVGSCEGTCQHVWNYAYALCFLFPDLERSIREYEFRYQLQKDGFMVFRTALPLGRPDRNLFHPCVDGQMGAVIKTYREWKISGDTAWLRSVWDKVKLCLEFAWSPDNAYEWDRNKDGILEGRQHHTLDMELFGPSSWLQSFYTAALGAAAEMAEALGEEQKAAEYRELRNCGRSWIKENLFNGSHFIQKIDLEDKSIVDHFDCANDYWNEETGEIKYQIGEGSAIDQMCGQWHAIICGLEDVFEKEQRIIALQNMMKGNFKESMREFNNPWRIFALNDESGTVICDYPEGSYKPRIPISYCEESMHGFEYQFAGLLAADGMIEDCIKVVKAVRDRYNGANRNPWNEIECGNNYARSMASYALLPILSGLTFDMTGNHIGFDPRISTDPFSCFFSLSSAWGNFLLDNGTFVIQICEGSLKLRSIGTGKLKSVNEVFVDGQKVDFTFRDNTVWLDEITVTKEIRIV